MKYAKLSAYLFLCSVLILSCSKKADPIPSSLEVTVANELGAFESGTLITLYKTEQDWKDEKNASYPAQVTDLTGKVTFSGLLAGSYYIKAVKQYYNNEKNMGLATIEASKSTKAEVMVKADKAEILAGITSRGWKYKSDESTAACPNSEAMHDDNTFFFFADQKMKYDRGTITDAGNCSDFVNLIGHWELSKNEDSLRVVADKREDALPIKSLEMFNGKIISIAPDKFEVQIQTVTATFTAR